MPYCPNCGAPVKAGEKYCFGCGTKIVSDGEQAWQNAGTGSPEYCEGGCNNNTSMNDERLRTPQTSSNESGQAGYERERATGADGNNNYAGSMRGTYNSEDRTRRDGMIGNQGSQERYGRGEDSVQEQPLPLVTVVPEVQAPIQQPPAIQVPDKPKQGFMSTVAKVLEILVYLGFIGAALAAIYLLYIFSQTAFVGMPGI